MCAVNEHTAPTYDDHSERRFEIISTVILALAALCTAWAGYQASLWDGVQSTHYEEASALRLQSAEKDAEADEYRLADLGVFENYVDARLTGNESLAAFYRGRFRPELEIAFEAWLDLDPWTSAAAPASPLGMPEYQLEVQQEADALAAQATEAFAKGQLANDYSDSFTLGTVLFAMALFFAAISERFMITGARWTLLGFGIVALLGGVVVVMLQPISFGS
jgi:hypothetical protein